MHDVSTKGSKDRKQEQEQEEEEQKPKIGKEGETKKVESRSKIICMFFPWCTPRICP